MALLDRVRTGVRDLIQHTGRVYWRGGAAARRVALTFDDGPHELTGAYLDVLERHGVAATFFIMGDLTEQAPAMVPEYLRRGHQLAGHGYDHTNLTTLSPRAIADQLERTEQAIGPQPQGRRWVRPPYGALNARVLGTMLARGYTVGMWSLDSLDHRDDADPDRVVATCAPAQITPGDVLLFHEGYQHTLAALPRIIDGLHGAGYELVTMADLVTR